MFQKILIANRGEIACRIIKTAKRLGIATVAVYSEADAQALHVELADEAYLIGPASSKDSYLRGDRIIEVALKSGAQAIHPGYGFLSENADFAEQCVKAGLIFIGPPASAIRAMGSKSAAKALVASAGVPIIPGLYGEQDPKRLHKAADAMGYPVLLKATAGGGGKGMRVVTASAQFQEHLAGAKREALASFGNDEVLIEKYLENPRHVEIQIFADTQGHVVHLNERDCSIQRRHQKVLEEAPAPGMTGELRARMGQMAVTCAKAIGYVGAGTIECLLTTEGEFYFMEMNTRLQVEHPVTEMITGLDLVEWQLQVASGEPLPLRQEQIHLRGHAIEIRIYAEDPSHEFLPSVGHLVHFRTPLTNPHVRIDTGVAQGSEVSPHYDPMLAKLIVWDTNREMALRRLRLALSEFQVVGVQTNICFLLNLANNTEFAQAHLHTGFIAQHHEQLIPKATVSSDQVLALASLFILLKRAAFAQEKAKRSHDESSPWFIIDNWRMNMTATLPLRFIDHTQEILIFYKVTAEGYELVLPNSKIIARAKLEGSELEAILDGRHLKTTIVQQGNELTIMGHGLHHRLSLKDLSSLAVGVHQQAAHFTAPMPGTVVAILVKAGEQVAQGAALIVIEAMKMEHTIYAPSAGIVTDIYFQRGEQVKEAQELLAFKETT
jgi:3-methylcrotonyl-CoA carboxylase alpha subunit